MNFVFGCVLEDVESFPYYFFGVAQLIFVDVRLVYILFLLGHPRVKLLVTGPVIKILLI